MVNNYVRMTFVFLALNGCSLSSSSGDPSLHLDLSSLQDRSGQYSLLNGGGFFSGLVSAPPVSATGFSCYGVNVTGPGIMDSSQNVERDPMVVFDQALNVPNTYCSYRGVVTPPIQLSSTGSADVALQVPPGGVRLVQVVGVNDPLVCASGVFGGNDNGGSGKYFEIGRGVVYDLFGDRSVEVTTNWPTAVGVQGDIDRNARTLDCGGNCVYPVDGPTNGVANYAGSVGMTAPTGEIAQKFSVAQTTYLRKVEVALTPSASATVTAKVYMDGVAPGDYTGWSTTASVTASGSPTMVTFDFFDPVNRYLALNSGHFYYLVFSTSAGTVNFNKSSTLGSAGDVGVNNGTWTYYMGQLFMKVGACN